MAGRPGVSDSHRSTTADDIRGSGDREHSIRTRTEDVLIIVLMVLSALILLSTFFPLAGLPAFFAQELEMKRASERIFSLVLVIMSWKLLQRRRAAWVVTVLVLVALLIQHLVLPIHHLGWVLVAGDLVFLIPLLVFRADFCCPSARESVRRSIGLLAIAAGAILLNAGVSYHLVAQSFPGDGAGRVFWTSLLDTLSLLFGSLDPGTQKLPGARFEEYIFWFTWACLLIALLYALQPFITRHLWTERNMLRARDIVLEHGQNPASYLTLEDDKYLFFPTCARGVVGYGVVGGTVVVNGDPVCAPTDFPLVLDEFKRFCTRSDHRLVFLSITDAFLDDYRRAGFGLVKCGEEARFDLASYDIVGKKGAKMRMNVNHATRAGLEVHEYRPLEKRDPALEAAFAHITDEWLAGKKGSLLHFTMGSTGLENPLDRRYFYATDPDGAVKGFHVLCPFAGGKGYMVDITRRTHDAPGGITEKINYEAFLKLKAEGYRYASLGVAPLANLCQDPDGSGPMEAVLDFVYEHLNSCYGFKDLYRTKASYSPTHWVPGYYAFLPKIPRTSMLYAIVRIQDENGIRGYAKVLLTDWLRGLTARVRERGR